jgi:hypothetical protein
MKKGKLVSLIKELIRDSIRVNGSFDYVYIVEELDRAGVLKEKLDNSCDDSSESG